ncbi:Smr/MutS family protein [Desulfonatronospira sp. MSAO_Bac3]|uniref:Smr/MutS family protein n=1 Tax=Desulfonatronospira sp. MSAO_Bac3 TaxID=2293857 RepID=UPI000FF4AF29|nr:Smr/MutS family protein [Desulfonatronospira sp. MSAO_Bac3]RQD77702.1 MAG: DNA mismatch repair protein MutS [Desulfonatronospira sp. MSAO_Bac3]
MKSLKELKKIKISSRKKEKNPEPPAPPEKKKDKSEENLFQTAMSGVKPLKGKGRDIPLETEPAAEGAPLQEESDLDTLYRLVRGDVEFDVQFSDEYIQGYVKSINSRTFRRFKNGELSIEAHLDLHGLNSDQARQELLHFMREQYHQGKTCVLLIPGRGKNSPLGEGVLRNEIQSWLTVEPLKRIVLAFCSALPRHGGTGALYVLMRSKKKTKGKIHWDKYLIDLY